MEDVEDRKHRLDATADTIPCDAGRGFRTAILPDRMIKDGVEKSRQILKDPAERDRLRQECDR